MTRRLLLCAVAILAASTARADVVLDPALQLTDLVTLPSNDVTDFRFLPDGRVVVTTRDGTVHLAQLSPPSSTVAGTLTVDQTGENGLLGVEVDPSFDSTRRLFFYRSLPDGPTVSEENRHVVASVTLTTGDGLDLDSYTEIVIGLRGDSPSENPGGAMVIDRRTAELYIGVGDTGCVADEDPSLPQSFYATCLSNPNGKVLRVNLDGSVPDTNPLFSFTGVPTCGAACNTPPNPGVQVEPRRDIWAWGFREPAGLVFDDVTRRLWMVDSGEDFFEEVNQVNPGKHYGWPWRIGNTGRGFSTSQCGISTPSSGDCIEPKYSCAPTASTNLDGECREAVGGAFLDTCTFPLAFRGGFYFADRQNGALFQLRLSAQRDAFVASPRVRIGTINTGGAPQRLQLGPDGNLYIATTGGVIKRLSPVTPATCDGDAGTQPGGGTGAPGGPPVGGGEPQPRTACGCSSGLEGAAAGAIVLLAWALARRRR